MKYIRCTWCALQVSSEAVPDDLQIRAYIECPLCADKLPDVSEIHDLLYDFYHHGVSMTDPVAMASIKKFLDGIKSWSARHVEEIPDDRHAALSAALDRATCECGRPLTEGVCVYCSMGGL